MLLLQSSPADMFVEVQATPLFLGPKKWLNVKVFLKNVSVETATDAFPEEGTSK